MAKFNLGGHKEGFSGDQDDMKGGGEARAGVYDVVITELMRREFGKGAKKINATCHILGAVADDNKDLIGSKFWLDFWADLSKKSNAAKMTYLVMAQGNDSLLDEFDIDSDDFLVKALTGKPFRLEIEVKDRPYESGGEKKIAKDVEVVKFELLTKEQRAVYNNEKWPSIVGKPEERMKKYEPKPSKGGGGKGGGPASAETSSAAPDPWADG